MTKDGFETYKLYLALQRHFSSNYDYFQYNGKVNVSSEAYSKRSDVFSFEKLSKIVPSEERVDFFVAHFVEKPKMWIREMNLSIFETHKQKYLRLKSNFREDLQKIKLEGPGQVMQTNGDIPKIHKMVMSKEINIESLIILNRIWPFLDRHEKEVNIPLVWPEHLTTVKKYSPFLLKKIESDYNIYTDIARTILLEE